MGESSQNEKAGPTVGGSLVMTSEGLLEMMEYHGGKWAAVKNQ